MILPKANIMGAAYSHTQAAVEKLSAMNSEGRFTLQLLQQSPLLHIASWVSVHFLQQAPPLRAHSCSHRHENKPSALV